MADKGFCSRQASSQGVEAAGGLPGEGSTEQAWKKSSAPYALQEDPAPANRGGFSARWLVTKGLAILLPLPVCPCVKQRCQESLRDWRCDSVCGVLEQSWVRSPAPSKLGVEVHACKSST